MKKLLPILLLAGFSSPAMADLTHKLSSSVQLSVNAAATQVDRVGSTFTISGSNIDTTDGTTAGTLGTLAGTITSAGIITVTGGGAGTVATGQFVNELTIN